jgi:hypothetical protein
MRRKSNPHSHARQPIPVNDEFHTWIVSLPWVVERPYVYESPGVRTFAIACEPLGIRQLWLVTGLPGSHRVAVVVPDPLVAGYEDDELGRAVAPMPAEHTLFGLYDNVAAIDVERVVLDAYGLALAR